MTVPPYTVYTSYSLSDKWDISTNISRYTAQPAYTTMRYKNPESQYANRNENLKYIASDHTVLGFEYRPHEKMHLIFEGFNK